MEVTKVEVLDNSTEPAEGETKEDSDAGAEPLTIRLTPTGKISHAKTRVYTQRYRKEWEHMTDFKDWLTPVPFQATRAFCKFCQRNLHAHRLSLLKHMCTLKHQRAAVQYAKRQVSFNGSQGDETSNDMNYTIERLDTEEEYDENDVSYDDADYVQEDGEEEEEILEDDVQEQQIIEEYDNESEPVLKKIKLTKARSPDALEQAMQNVHSDYSIENDQSMNMESDHDGYADTSKSIQIVKFESLMEMKNNTETRKKIKLEKGTTINADDSARTLISIADPKNMSVDNSKKFVFMASNGKSYAIVKGKIPKNVLMNQINNKNLMVVAKPPVEEPHPSSGKNPAAECVTPTSGNQDIEKVISTPNTSSMNAKSLLLKKPMITTHVIETSKGGPVNGLQVSLYKLQDGRWTFIHEGTTTANGNCNDFSSTARSILTTGRYKLHYDVEKYYSSKKTATIYPFIEIVFDIKDPGGSYHVPLLLSPFSYSTFRDSSR